MMLAGCASSPKAKEAKFIQKGQALLVEKAYSRAILEFKNAAQVAPKDAEPYYQLALAFLANGNTPEAFAALHKATELNPKHSDAQLKLAELLALGQNKDLLEQAAKRLQDVLAVSPDSEDATDTLAMAELQLGKTDDAAKELEDSLQKFPARLKSSVVLARIKLGQNNLNGAEEVLKSAVDSAPQSSAALVALGELYILANKLNQAEEQLRRAFELDPNNAAALLSLAHIQIEEKRMEDAEKTYQQLSALPDKANRHLHAVFLYQTGKKDAAVAELEKLAKDDSSDRAARSRLVTAYIETNRLTEAETLVAGALERNPRDTDALLNRGEMYLKAKNFAEAERDLREVLHFQPDSVEAHTLLAGVYKGQGNRNSQREQLNTALNTDEESLPVRLTLARSFVLQNDPKSALAVLDQAPPSQKHTVAVIIERNWALLEAGNTKELRTILDQSLPVAHVPELLLQDALLKISEKDYATARLRAEEVLKQNPEDSRAARIVADSYTAQNQSEKAIQRLTELAAARPQSAPLQYLLGLWCAKAGKAASAKKAFEAAISADSHYLNADLALAEIEHQQDQDASAQQRLKKIIAADPRNVFALLLLASIDEETGNQAEAVAGYRSALAIDSSNVFALNNLASAVATHNPDEALMLAQQAAGLAAENAAVQDTLGWIYYRKRIYDAAVTHLKKAVSEEPTPRHRYHLALSYVKAGNSELGQEMLRSALKDDPSLRKTVQQP